MKEYIKPKVVVVTTPASLMKGDGSINIGIATSPDHTHGQLPAEAKQFNGMTDWEDDETSENGVASNSSWE